MNVAWHAVVITSVLLSACSREPGSTTLTTGSLVVECDESVYPVMRQEAEAFLAQYPGSAITVRSVQAREATANFVNDSVRVIVSARAFNAEEVSALKAGKVQYDEYLVARSAVSVVLHKDNPVQQIRLGELDSLFGGVTTRWSGIRGRPLVELFVGGADCSINEIFRAGAMGGKPLALSATPVASSGDLVGRVRDARGGIGIVSPAWLKGYETELNVPAVGSPTWQPDTLGRPGQYYTPAQAYVFLGYYPIVAPVYIYSREIERNISLGFISFVSSAPGQKIIQEGALVPAKMPVRIVQLTSGQVK
jgi:ABC-type phosphate transport system substrate-binding protein